jgi:reactive intermediate/imine deaminase
MSSNADIKYVATDRAPAPGGHYSQAVICGNLVFVSGQLPISPDGKFQADASFEQQAHLAINNLIAIVEAGNSSKDKILNVRAYIVGIDYWPAFNGIYAGIFGSTRPARAIVPVPALHHGFLIELEAVACLSM